MKNYAWTVAGLPLEFVDADDSIIRLLHTGKDFEPNTVEKWGEICDTGGTVVDVGCYTGLFSIIAARLGCHVIAFEPMRKNFERCLENFHINGVVVDIRYACASDRDGPTEIKFNPRVPFLTSGASLIRPSGGMESRAHQVMGATIDSLGLTQCTAIKIDVERGEPMVLAGARETIRRCKPVLLVEVLGPSEGELIKVPGYRVADVLDERNWLMLPE